jgi:hypothetical protein
MNKLQILTNLFRYALSLGKGPSIWRVWKQWRDTDDAEVLLKTCFVQPPVGSPTATILFQRTWSLDSCAAKAAAGPMSSNGEWVLNG